jgi:hypothetical protein
MSLIGETMYMGTGRMWEISMPSRQFCCEPKTLSISKERSREPGAVAYF